MDTIFESCIFCHGESINFEKTLKRPMRLKFYSVVTKESSYKQIMILQNSMQMSKHTNVQPNYCSTKGTMKASKLTKGSLYDFTKCSKTACRSELNNIWSGKKKGGYPVLSIALLMDLRQKLACMFFF